MYRVHADAPPFFVIHGDRDTLAPVEEARRFVESCAGSHARRWLRRAARCAARLRDLPVAPTALVIHGVERFLAHLYSEYLVATRQHGNTEKPLVAS